MTRMMHTWITQLIAKVEVILCSTGHIGRFIGDCFSFINYFRVLGGV